jgi:hypothetical protein
MLSVEELTLWKFRGNQKGWEVGLRNAERIV